MAGLSFLRGLVMVECMNKVLSRVTFDPEICHDKPAIRQLRYPAMLFFLASIMIAQDASGNTNEVTAPAIGSSDPTSRLLLIPSVTRGYAPLTVTFTVNASALPGTVRSVAWDWGGNGTTDLTSRNVSKQTHAYDAGTYRPVVTVTTSKGTFSSGGGNKADMLEFMAGKMVTIVADMPPQITWSQNVAGPVAVKANADGSVYVLRDNPPAFLRYSSNGAVLASFDLTTIQASPVSANGFDVDSKGNVYVARPR
jgi:PKD repeat protein